MRKRLIVNADDYGRSPRIWAGIRKVHFERIVTRTTAMMNTLTVVDTCAWPGTVGCPLCPIESMPTLVTGSGDFSNISDLHSPSVLLAYPALSSDNTGKAWLFE